MFFNKHNHVFFISISSLLFIGLGAIRYQITLPKYQKKHLIHQKTAKGTQELIFTILKKFNTSDTYQKFNVTIHTINKHKVIGNALLTVKKDSTKVAFYKGDSFVYFGKLSRLKKHHNPYSFDYTTYLNTQRITHQFWAKPTELKQIESLANPLNNLINTLKKHLEINLKKQKLHSNTLQLTAALVLGNKSEMNKQLNVDFANAGVIHVLAISGLHIGIIYLLFIAVFHQFLANTVFKSLVIISFLWLFAWFSGASPSAIRATTMFSCFEFSRLLMRKQHPLNSLFVSIFILNLFDPYTLFSVGFQLSVIAVGSIIIGTPKLLALWSPKKWLIRKIWEIISISTCAQIGLLPLSIYYFHQFPGLFLIANIPIMLIITIVLISAIAIVIWSSLGTIPFFITESYNYFITTIYNYIHWVSQQKNFLFTELYIQASTLIFAYATIALLFYSYKKPKLIYQWSFPVTLIAIGIIFYEKASSLFKNELWLHSHYTNTIISEISPNQINVYSKNTLTDKDKKYIISPIEGNLHSTGHFHKLKNSYTYNDQTIHIINHKNSLPNTIENTILILTDSPKINLERLLANQTPKLVIATTHNYKNLVQKWKATCLLKQVAFYDSSQKGSLNLTTKLLSL